MNDLGTPGLDLVPWVTDLEALILVDTVRSEAPPGTIRLYRRDDILKHPPQTRLSPHDPGLKEALLTAEFAGQAPGRGAPRGGGAGADGDGCRLEPGRPRAPWRPPCPRCCASWSAWGDPRHPRDTPEKPQIWWEEPGAEGRPER